MLSGRDKFVTFIRENDRECGEMALVDPLLTTVECSPYSGPRPFPSPLFFILATISDSEESAQNDRVRTDRRLKR